MKKLLFVFLAFTAFQQTNAQYYNCNSGRYIDSLFDVQISAATLYGSNLNYAGTSTNLNLKVYTPAGDTATKRPLIIFAPKGSFMSEDKDEWVMVQLCKWFAQRGYVCAAIDYRVGIDYMAAIANPPLEFTKAVIRAVHDYKAAIRFFRKDAATTNTYKIDPDMIIAGGSSAGAITALHVAYLDKLSELPTYIDTTGLGGLEGLSGNPGYPSTVNCVVNLCGALADSVWLEAGNVPVISMHGNLDTEVPYGKAMITMIINIMVVNGSASIHQRALHVGVNNPFHTFWGRTHIPYDPNAGGSYTLYMDTVLNYVTTNLYNILCSANFGVSEINTDMVRIYPNPAETILYLNFDRAFKNVNYDIFDLTGKLLMQNTIPEIQPGLESVNIANLKKGLYFIRLTTGKETQTVKFFIE